MPYPHPYRCFSRKTRLQDDRNIPAYSATQFIYYFEEGVDNSVSMNNILIDSRYMPVIGAEVVTNYDFEGTYVGGVAPSWTVDAGVTASESTDDAGGKAQRLTNMNGFAQAMRQTLAGLTVGQVYRIEFTPKYISGAGTLRLRATGFSSTSFDVSNAKIPTGFKAVYFYGVATAASFDIEITSDNTALTVDIAQVTVKAYGGQGNHLVMDHNLYSRSSRGVNYYDFDGATQYFYIKDTRATGLDMATKWSYLAIARWDASATGVLASKFNPSGNQRGWQASRFQSGSRRLETYWSSNGTATANTIGTTNVLPAPPWATYRCVGHSFDGTSLTPTSHYLNATLTTNASTNAGTAIFNNTSDMRIGTHFDGVGNPTLYFNGRIGKMIIWSGVALTASQHRLAFNLLRSGYGI